MGVGGVVDFEKELESRAAAQAAHRQDRLPELGAVGIDADLQVRAGERKRSAAKLREVEREIHVGFVVADTEQRGVLAEQRPFLQHRKRAPAVGSPAEFRRDAGRTREQRHDAVVLFGAQRVVPLPRVLARQLEVGREPVLLEPLVDPREKDLARGTGLADLGGQARIHRRCLTFVESTVVESLRLQVGVSPARGNAELRDHERDSCMVLLERAKIADVVGRTEARSRRRIRRVVENEVGVVRVHVVAREPSGRICRGGVNEVGIERRPVLLVRRQSVVGPVVREAPELHLFVVRRLRRVLDRVRRRPVRVGDRAQGVVRVELVREQVVALRCHPYVRRTGGADREESAGVFSWRFHPLVVEDDRIRLPLSSHDVRDRPRRDVGVVATSCVSGRRCEIRGAVQEIHHALDLGVVAGVEGGVVEVIVRRQLRPHAVHDVEGPIGVREIPAPHGTIERRRQNRIDAKRVGVHRRNRVEPPCVERRVGRELRRELSGESHPHVDALDEEGTPRVAHAKLEVFAGRPGGELERSWTTARRSSGSFPVRGQPGEQSSRAGVLWIERHRPPRRPNGAGEIPPPVRRGRKPIPRVGVGGIPLGDALEGALRFDELVESQ